MRKRKPIRRKASGTFKRKPIRVTSVLSFVNSSWKEFWFRKVGIEAADQISKESREFGTKVHELIECYLKTGNTDFSSIDASQDHMECADLVISWLKENKVKPLHIEVLLKDSSLNLIGHADLIAQIGNEIVVIDWKMSNSHRKEYVLQKAAYAHMAKPTLKLYVDKGITVRVDKETKALDVKEYTNLKKYWKIFRQCLDVYKYFYYKAND